MPVALGALWIRLNRKTGITQKKRTSVEGVLFDMWYCRRTQAQVQVFVGGEAHYIFHFHKILIR